MPQRPEPSVVEGVPTKLLRLLGDLAGTWGDPGEQVLGVAGAMSGPGWRRVRTPRGWRMVRAKTSGAALPPESPAKIAERLRRQMPGAEASVRDANTALQSAHDAIPTVDRYGTASEAMTGRGSWTHSTGRVQSSADNDWVVAKAARDARDRAIDGLNQIRRRLGLAEADAGADAMRGRSIGRDEEQYILQRLMRQ